MSDPNEASKINRLRKELSRSNNLTVVENEFKMFEAATNKHFNHEMNKAAQNDRRRATQSHMYTSLDSSQ